MLWGCVLGVSDSAAEGVWGKSNDLGSPDLLEVWGVCGAEGVAGEGEESEVDVALRTENCGWEGKELGEVSEHWD